MATHTNLSPEAISRYRTTMQQRGESAKKNLQERQLKAHQIAQQAADLLREQFAVSQVILFGSLAHEHWFSATSDIDLAVWGLDRDLYFLAVAKLQDLSPEFKIDLVDMNNCPLKLRDNILKEGQNL